MPTLTLHNQYAYTDVLKAYFDCRKHKRMTGSALAFELKFEQNLYTLTRQINNNTYIIGPTRAFVVTYPKPREVWAALFRDRIVHHLIYNDIAPYFEGHFIEDTYSCIKNRGTLLALIRCKHFLERATQYWSKPAWVLQLDIKNFFVSINKHILYDLIAKHFDCNCLLLDLIRYVIYNDPTQNALVDSYSDFGIIPPHKSLWNANKNHGLPIGNLTSQLFANIYLDELDKFIKHILKVKFYGRYVDDFYIIHTDKDLLYKYCEKINLFLRSRLQLELSVPKTKIKAADSGITFLGTTIYPFHALPRKMNVAKLKEVARQLQKNYTDPFLLASINSYLGMLKQADTFQLRKRICEQIAIPTLLGYNETYSKLVRLHV